MQAEKTKRADSNKTATRAGITIPQSRILDLLKDSVTHSLEGGKKGSRFPVLHAYLEMEGEDVTKETVKKLREEFAKIRGSFSELQLGVMDGGQLAPVEKISGRASASSPDAGLLLRNVGVPHDFPAREKVSELLDSSIAMCDEAIRRDCGFGKYSKPA